LLFSAFQLTAERRRANVVSYLPNCNLFKFDMMIRLSWTMFPLMLRASTTFRLAEFPSQAGARRCTCTPWILLYKNFYSHFTVSLSSLYGTIPADSLLYM